MKAIPEPLDPPAGEVTGLQSMFAFVMRTVRALVRSINDRLNSIDQRLNTLERSDS